MCHLLIYMFLIRLFCFCTHSIFHWTIRMGKKNNYIKSIWFGPKRKQLQLNVINIFGFFFFLIFTLSAQPLFLCHRNCILFGVKSDPNNPAAQKWCSCHFSKLFHRDVIVDGILIMTIFTDNYYRLQWLNMHFYVHYYMNKDVWFFTCSLF